MVHLVAGAGSGGLPRARAWVVLAEGRLLVRVARDLPVAVALDTLGLLGPGLVMDGAWRLRLVAARGVFGRAGMCRPRAVGDARLAASTTGGDRGRWRRHQQGGKQQGQIAQGVLAAKEASSFTVGRTCRGYGTPQRLGLPVVAMRLEE
jgi:hypothetical protein